MPEIDLFAFLDEASPWWWVAFAIALGAVEMLTFSYFLIWPALAALATAIMLWIAPGMGGTAQVALFAVLSVVFTIAGRYVLAKTRPAQDGASRLNRRADRLVGRSGKAMNDFDVGEGMVEIDGVGWRARVAEGGARKDQRLEVVGVDGMTLICRVA